MTVEQSSTSDGRMRTDERQKVNKIDRKEKHGI